MGDTVNEIESSSSSQDSDLILSSSGGSIFSQQNTSGSQSQNRRRHSLSLKKKRRENDDQSDENIETKSRPRQPLFSCLEAPKTDSSAITDNNCELFKRHSTGQSIGNNTSVRSNITERNANHSRNKDSNTPDMFGICELNSSSQSQLSIISSQHEVAESELQTEHEHSVLSHEKRRRENKCRTEQHKKNSKGRRVRKDLFDSFGMSSSSSSDDMKIAETDLPCSQSQWSGNASNVRKTAKLSLVKSPQLTGSEKQEPCSSSTSDASRNTFKNLFDNFSHEKKILTDIEATPKLQNQTKETKFATKAVKETSKRKSPEDAIVIDDSPDRNAHSRNLNASVRENTMHHETKPGALETVGANSHLIHHDRTLSKNEKEKQENVSCDFPSQKDSARPELSHSQASSSGSFSHVLLERLKQKRSALTKLLTSKIVSASVKQNSKKALAEEAVVISSDEETEEINESQVQLCHIGESGLNKKTLGLKMSKSTSLSQKQNSSTDVKQCCKINKPVAGNLSSSASCHSSVRKTFPALYNSFSSSLLSQEIPDQGTIDNQNNANRDSGIPRLATVSSNTSVSSMPSLQKRPSSMYRSNSFEECSPPMLSQYPIPSPPTSLHLPEEVSHTDLLSPMKNDVNKSASEDVISSESSMFTECSVSGNDNPEDDLNGKLTDLIDMLDTAEDDQQVVERTQPECSTGSKIDQLLQSGEMKSSETSHVSISSKSPRRQLNTEKLNTGTDLEVAKKEGCDSALRGKEKSPHYSDKDEEIYVFDSDDDFMSESLQDTHCSKRQESENCMKDGGEDSSDVNKVDGQVLTAGNFDGRTTLNHPNENKQVSLEHTSGSRKDGGLTASEKDQDQNDLVVELEPQIPVVGELEPSAAADFSVTVAVSLGGSSQTSDAGIAVVKEEVDDNAFTGAADSSMYSEINDEVYILDSDDDEFFMTQSVLTNLSDKQEDEQNCTENEWRSALYEKDNHNLLDGKCDDKVTYNKQLNENDVIVVKDVPDCSLADEIDDPSDFEIYDGMDSSFDDLDQENPNTETNKNDSNEPSEVNIDDMAKSTVDDDVDDIFLSQIDDIDAYFAHTQIDYTTHSDDEFEVECKDYVDVLKSSRAVSSPVTLDRLGKSSENISASVSSCEGADTQDPFTAETQVGYPSETNDQNHYDVATLPVSSTVDEDAQIQVDNDEYAQIQVKNKMHTTLDFITKQNLCDQNRHEENELNVSPMLNADTQDPYSLETQHNSDVLMEEHHSLDKQLPVSHKSHVGRVFTMEIQEFFEDDDHDTDPYNKETLSVSSSSSEHSESVFTLLQTQFNTEPEENNKNEKGREKDVDYFFVREDKLNVPSTEGLDSIKLAKHDKCKSGFHTSCASVNDRGTQDQSDITAKENDQLLSEDNDAYKRQTQVFPPGKMLESSHDIATLKNVQSESSDDQAAVALLNDGDTLDQFDFTTQDDDHLLVSDEDSAYEGQTQVFSPARELQTSYNVATQKVVQSEVTDYQADTVLLNDDDRQDHFDIRTKDHVQLESEDDDDVYGGQTQQFSPGKELHNSEDTATAKNVQPEEDECHLFDIQTLADSPLLNDADAQDQFDIRTKDHDQLESDDDDVYGAQTQQFSPGNELHNSEDAATAKNVQPEEDDCHLYELQTLADSPLLNDSTQDLFDDEVQEQLSSNEKYIYEGQTLANSSHEDSESVYNIETQRYVLSKDNDHELYDREKCGGLTSVDDVTEVVLNKETKRNQQAALEEDIYEQQTLASSQRNKIDDFYNMPTQNNFQSDKSDHILSGIERSITSLDEEDTLDPSDQEAFPLASEAALEDRCLYEQQTLASSQRNENGDFYNIPTQSNFLLDKRDHTLSGNKMSITSMDEEDTQDPSDCETQAFHLASEDRYPCEREMLAACQDEENLYNKATQKMSQPERNSPSPYNRETLALSPTVGETCLHTAEKLADSKSNHHCPTDRENLSPSSSVDTQDPFDMETNVSSLEDQDGEKFAASSSLRRNIENNCLLQMKTDVSPVTEHGISNRETTAASTTSRRDDDSSNDSDCIFIMKTQKDSSSLATDQDPYALQTQAVSTSFNEDIHGPFSVETLIDSPPRLEIDSPYDRETLDISMVSENSQDPFSVETEVDTSSFEEQNSVGLENALATTSSCNKEAEINVIETLNSVCHVQTLVPHETIVVAHLSVIGNGSREKQIQSDLETQLKSNDPLSAQGQSLQYLENQIHKQLQSLTSEPDDSVLPSKATQYNKEGNISTNIQDSNVHHLQISEKNSDNQNFLTAKSILQSLRNSSAATNLIKRLSFNSSQKVQQPPEDVNNSSGQDDQSPYFVNCQQNSPTVKDANTTGSCCLSSPTRDAKNVSSSGENILQIPDAKGLSAQDSCMATGISLNTHPLQQDLTHQRHREKTFGLSKSNLGSIKRPAVQDTETSSKRKCIAQCRDFHTEGSSGIAGRKRSTENKELNTHLPYSKRLKVVSAENTSSEHTWITARKGDSSGGKHKSTTVAKNTSKFKRPRSKKVKEVTKGCLTSQVELAKLALQNRMMESRSVKPVDDQKAKSMMNDHDDDEDVVMPSTQDMMNLGLPILSAKLPVSKKHLVSGLPSQGRLASDDKELQDKIVNDQKTKSLMNDDNEDVAMPSTQDMMNLGLPILSAKRPVSKKHLASGLPSQGRLASDDKQLQDKIVNDQKAKSLMNDNEDVAVPSTQDMMNLELTILSAKLPVSKKHLASGLPSQGRLASDDKQLQDKIVNDQQAKSLMNDDNQDVAMPSTQDMMNLGLPILSANLPVSKKHLASGLPSQGRLASDDKELQDKTKNASGGKPLNGVCCNKNSTQKDVLPSVPLFCPLAASRNISSSAASTAMPAHPAVSLETPASSATSSTESKEPSLDQSLVMSNCHKDSGSLPDKLSTQTHTAVILPVSSSSDTSPAETVLSSSAKFIHADVALPSQPGVSSERVYPNGRGLPSLQGVLKQSTETLSSHHGILKSSKPSEQNEGKKAAPKVTFDLYRERQSVQRREATKPQAVVLQPIENAKNRPEAKLYFLTTILHWNTMWLKEKEKIQSLPALFGGQQKVEDACCQLRIYYSTFKEYVDITMKLLILECWETIYRDWKMCSLRPSVTLDVYCTCKPWQPHKEKEGQSLVFIGVTGLATQQTRSNIPSVGDFLIMDFWGARKLEEKKYDEPRKFTQFAYVKSVAVQYDDIRQFVQMNPIFASSSALRDQKPLMVKMTLILQHRGAVIIPSNLHKVQVISSLKTMSRQIDALINLPESPLCMQLLKPTSGGLFAYTSMKPDAHLLSKLNQEQACSVATIVQEVKRSPTSQKMFFLQGPPGTGKSHTILALIHQILIVTNFKGRICLAAPSNAAVDEMAKRIISFSKKLTSSALQGISLVRVGNKNKVHSVVKPFMLEDLVEEILNKDIPNSLKFELSALEEAALKLERELSDKSLTYEKKVINSRKQKEIKDKIFKLKADMAPKKKNGRERYNARCSVLDNAQVICGTLNSLGSEDLQQIVLRTEENRHKKLPFTCLIIDEATQAIEVECLIPLRYKMTKVVLVGDPEQLPATVLSQMATEKQLARSLFERMDFYIRQCLKTSKSPVMMLTRQYRMHKEILNLPNSFFYDGQLVTDESVIARKELIAPYLVFDIQDSKESKDTNTGSVSNKEEAVCIAQLCEIVSKKIDKIGVICPYTDQQRSLLGCLRDRNLAIEVNTVDSFQGQEREVIILSCVRAQSNPSSIGFLSDRKRMNVALTRARLALYVIGNFDTLKTDELWEQLYRNAMERNLLVKVQKTSDFKLIAESAVCRVKNYITNR